MAEKNYSVDEIKVEGVRRDLRCILGLLVRMVNCTIGGGSLGGNLWALDDVTGFSETRLFIGI